MGIKDCPNRSKSVYILLLAMFGIKQPLIYGKNLIRQSNIMSNLNMGFSPSKEDMELFDLPSELSVY